MPAPFPLVDLAAAKPLKGRIVPGNAGCNRSAARILLFLGNGAEAIWVFSEVARKESRTGAPGRAARTGSKGAIASINSGLGVLPNSFVASEGPENATAAAPQGFSDFAGVDQAGSGAAASTTRLSSSLIAKPKPASRASSAQ